jgi:hypothetical protein
MEATQLEVIKYGFSMPEALGDGNDCCTDKDLAMITVDNMLYLVYRKKGTKELYVSVGTVPTSGRDSKPTWSKPGLTGSSVDIATDDFPALTFYNKEIYLFWRTMQDDLIQYGVLDQDTLKVRDLQTLPDSIKSKQSVAVVAGVYSALFNFWHLGKTSDDIYQSILTDNNWNDNKIASDSDGHDHQDSPDAPQVVLHTNGNTLTLHMIHRSTTVLSNGVYHSYCKNGEWNNWTKNKLVKVNNNTTEIGTNHRAGIGIWNTDYLIVVYRDSMVLERGLRLTYLDMGSGDWNGNDYILDVVFNSDFAPALSPYLDKDGNQCICMVWADKSSTDDIKVSTSQAIITL